MAKEKLDSVEALRGVAACYVALFHLPYITFPAVQPPAWAAPFANAGMSAVSLFFVISAFTLCISASSRASEPRATLNYLIRRFFRIAPLFYVWIALACIRDYALFSKTHSGVEIFLNATFAFNFSESTVEGIPWAAWTIGVEMVFYVTFPLFYRTLDNMGKSVTALATTALIGIWWGRAFHGTGHEWMFGFLSRLPIFILGIVVYHVYRMVRDSASAQRHGLGYALSGVGVFGYMATAYLAPSEAVLPHDYQQALCWAAIALGLSLSPVALVVNRVTGFMGRISYSVYLSHATLLHLLSGAFAWIYAESLSPSIGYLVSYACAVLVITCVSYATYRFVEEPGNRLGSKIIRRINRPRTTDRGLATPSR